MNNNINCNDPEIYIENEICQSNNIKPYISGLNSYINTMNEYCNQSDRVISNPLCNDYIENNPFIKNNVIRQSIKAKIPNLCNNNTNPDLNQLCINQYNIKPTLLIQEEEKIKKEEERIKKEEEDKKARNNLIMWISISIGIGGLIGYGTYKKIKKNKN